MTSTTGGSEQPSFGWIGRAAIASGERQPHINVFGGEDRFWLGPEGGQFALFFKRGDPFDLDHWQVPAPLDWGSWEVLSYNDGPPAPGKAPLGPFFELETSSPALDLLPAQRYTHVHRTFHLVGPEAELDRVARATIEVGLDELANPFSAQR